MSLDTASTTEASWSSSSSTAAGAVVTAMASSSSLSSTVVAATEGPTTTAPLTTTTAAAAAVSSTVSNAIVNSVKTLISSTSPPTTTSTMKPSITSLPTEKLNVADISSSLQHFGYVDYFVFIMMLLVCAVIGFYFGFIEKKKKKNKKGDAERRGSEALDYLVGGRKMKVFPVSLSLVASFVSGISLLGTSTEIYVYGTRYAFILITLAVSGVISWYIFLPVFCNLQLTSTYEYLEMRYNSRVRLLGSTLFTLSTLFWLPIVIYVPALAFNQVTGVNVHVVTPVVCIVCIFYTTVGGLKAVVWTDVIQTVVMLGAIILVVIKGTIDVGGLGVVWQRNMESGRIEWPAMTLDHTERMSMLSIFVGITTYYIQVLGGNQVIVQRYFSLPGMKEVREAHCYFIIGVIILTSITAYNGLLLFATYHDCDPLSTKLATEKDALVPLLVMDLLSIFPGLPGMFVAGVFSAALSSLSTGLNSLVAVFLEDYIKPLRKTPLTEKQTAFVMRLLTVVLGTFCVVCVYVVERMGKHVMELTMTLCSITMGPLLGMFLMGLLVPRINSKSAFAGSLISFIIMVWIGIQGQLAMNAGELKYITKPVTTAGCTYAFNATHLIPTDSNAVDSADRTFSQQIYHMAFALYSFVGTLLTVIFAFISTYFYGCNDVNKMNLELLAPFVRRRVQATSEYLSVQSDEQTVIIGLKANKINIDDKLNDDFDVDADDVNNDDQLKKKQTELL